MSSRDPFGIDPEDLGVRARRGLLSKAEQRELERATDASASLRIAYDVGRDLDAVTAVRGGDDALIANAAVAALARVGSAFERGADMPRAARGKGRRWSAVAIAVSILAGSGVAAALWTGVVVWPLVPANNSKPAPDVAARSHASRSHAQAAIATAPVQVNAPAAPVVDAETVPVKAAPVGSHARNNKNDKNAAELFHAANSARRDADFTRAGQLYAELRSAYPESAEAELARVSLGQLLLARDDAAAAEREFRHYLARGRGQLVEEALLGRAQSLERIGNAREERESLQRLLTEFPRSVYGARARARLSELEHEATTSAH